MNPQDKAAVELKPFPFCGGVASIDEIDVGAPNVTLSVGCDDPDCLGCETYGTFQRRIDAVEAWNLRAEPASDKPGARDDDAKN